jgi:YD repeat-containing protein
MSKSTHMRAVMVPLVAVVTLLAALITLPPTIAPAAAATTNSVSLTGPNSGPWDSTRSVTAVITASPATAANRRLVRFELRAVGAPAWTVMGTTATAATSSKTTFRFSLAVSGNYEFRATVLATSTAPEATSPIRSFSITPAPTSPDTKASTPISSRTLGVNGTQGNVIPSSLGSVRLWDAGVSWREIETKKGVYTWTRLDSLVKGALSRGQQILYVFGMTPTFYAQSPTTYSSVDPNRYYPGMAQPPTQLGGTDPSMAAYRAFVRALVTRYAGKITAYESWNEVNLTAYWQGTADQAALLAWILGQEVAGRATLVSGSIALRSPSSFHPFAGDYLAGLAARGWPVDVYSLHPYPNFDGAAKDSGNLVGMWQRLVRDRGAPAKELWSTEINYRANGTQRLDTQYDFDRLNRLQQVLNQPSAAGQPAERHAYTYNAAQQRIRDELADGSSSILNTTGRSGAARHAAVSAASRAPNACVRETYPCVTARAWSPPSTHAAMASVPGTSSRLRSRRAFGPPDRHIDASTSPPMSRTTTSGTNGRSYRHFLNTSPR